MVRAEWRGRKLQGTLEESGRQMRHWGPCPESCAAGLGRELAARLALVYKSETVSMSYIPGQSRFPRILVLAFIGCLRAGLFIRSNKLRSKVCAWLSLAIGRNNVKSLGCFSTAALIRNIKFLLLGELPKAYFFWCGQRPTTQFCPCEHSVH